MKSFHEYNHNSGSSRRIETSLSRNFWDMSYFIQNTNSVFIYSKIKSNRDFKTELFIFLNFPPYSKVKIWKWSQNGLNKLYGGYVPLCLWWLYFASAGCKLVDTKAFEWSFEYTFLSDVFQQKFYVKSKYKSLQQFSGRFMNEKQGVLSDCLQALFCFAWTSHCYQI